MVTILGVPLLRRQLGRPSVPMTTAPCGPGSCAYWGPLGLSAGQAAVALGRPLQTVTLVKCWVGVAVARPSQIRGVDLGQYLRMLTPTH